MHASDLAPIPIITTATGVLRALWPGMPKRLAPLVAVLAGVGVAAATGGWALPVILQGAVNGLAASGLWSGMVKPTVHAVRARRKGGKEHGP